MTPKHFKDTWAPRITTLTIFLALWEVAGLFVHNLILATPTAILVKFVELVARGELQTALFVSLQALIVGYVTAILVGVMLGLIMGRMQIVERSLDWLINALYATPYVALIPLIVIWLGLGFEARVFSVFFASFFPIVINTFAGAKDVPHNLLETARSFCARPQHVFLHIVFPHSVPFIVAGLRLGLGRGIVAEVVAELFMGSVGLGWMLSYYSNFFETAIVFSIIVLLALLGTFVNEGLKVLEKRISPWRI